MEELTKNFTENEKRNLTNTKLHCFPEAEFAAEVNDLLIFIAVLNIFLSITALLGNTLILSALRKETSLQPASKILYRNLTITDLCVGVIVQPLGAAYSLSEVNETWIICSYTGLTAFTSAVILCLASLRAVTAISVDRLLVLLLGFKYKESCYSKESKYNSSRYIGLIHCWCIQLRLSCHNCIYLSIYVIFFLHKNFPRCALLSNSCSESVWRATETSNATEYRSIQKRSVQCIMGTCCNDYLLSTSLYCRSFNKSNRDDFVTLHC